MAATPASSNAAPPPAANAETGIDNFLALMRRELVEPLKRVGELAERIEGLRTAGYLSATIAGEQVFNELGESTRQSIRIANRLFELGDVLAGPPILTDERILVADTLRHAAIDLSGTAESRRAGIRLDLGSENLAPVYGSTHWLGIALHRLLALLVAKSPAGAHLLIHLRQVGFHQLVSGDINHNAPSARTLDLLRNAPRGVKAELAAASSVDALDLILARAIIELHGGMLKAETGESGTLEHFTLTLPTGEPQAMRQRNDCNQCPYMRQAEQFAEDIGALLNGLAAPTPPSTTDATGSRS